MKVSHCEKCKCVKDITSDALELLKEQEPIVQSCS